MGVNAAVKEQGPDASRQGKGTPVVNLVQLDAGETVQSVLTIPKGKTTGFYGV